MMLLEVLDEIIAERQIWNKPETPLNEEEFNKQLDNYVALLKTAPIEDILYILKNRLYIHPNNPYSLDIPISIVAETYKIVLSRMQIPEILSYFALYMDAVSSNENFAKAMRQVAEFIKSDKPV